MNGIIPNGTEVLVFRDSSKWNLHSRDAYDYDSENYVIIGTVQSSEKSEDLSYHGSPYYEDIYKVLGEDGKVYVCTHSALSIKAYYFRTRDEFIRFLEINIDENERKILELQEKNIEYNNKISLLENKPKRVKKRIFSEKNKF